MTAQPATGTNRETSEISIRLQGLLDRQRTAYLADAIPTARERKENLTRLEKLLVKNTDSLAAAVLADYGSRSDIEIRMSEIYQPLAAIRYARKRVRKWMKPRRGHIEFIFKPSRAKVIAQPLGVVGIISPWNYPVSLIMIPLAAALAAGNRVMLKPSEITSRSADLMQKLITETFPEEVVTVVTGGPDVGQAFSSLDFDHLLFTGSTQLGRHIMRAAADNLTPVTLELGGKSPVIVHPDYPMAKAAERILSGKYFNGGQTCIAPDYVLIQKDKVDSFVETLSNETRRLFPTIYNNPDYTAVVNKPHYDRLQSYLSDAAEKGATLVEITSLEDDPTQAGFKIAPTFVLGGTDDMKIMTDEIFGPLLPIVAYEDLDDAIKYVNDRARPLALYYFDRNGSRVNHVLNKTTAGGVTINDTIFHVAQDDIPFGGVGDSGMGAYHGKEGFETFTHRKSVFYQSRFANTWLLTPPYTNLARRLVNFLIGK